MRLASWRALFFIIFCVLSVSALGAENIVIPTDNLKVYSNSDIASPVIGILHRGSVVPAATKPVGNFRKVLIVVSGQKKIGYINLYDIKGPLKTMPVTPPPPTPTTTTTTMANGAPAPHPQRMVRRRVYRRPYYQGLHHRKYMALIVGLEYENQGARTYTDSAGTPINVGTLTGSMAQFGLAYGLPLSYNFTLEPYFLYKPISVTGSATPSGSPTTPLAIILQQTYVSLGLQGKKYGSNTSRWWWGGGLQFDYGLSGTLQLGSSTPSNQGSVPDFFMAYLTTGFDLNISKSLFVIPDLRVGAIVNTSPVILEASFNLNFAYAF